MTPAERAKTNVLQNLALMAQSSRSIGDTVKRKAPEELTLAAGHTAEARIYELLHAEISSGLLERLEAGRL